MWVSIRMFHALAILIFALSAVSGSCQVPALGRVGSEYWRVRPSEITGTEWSQINGSDRVLDRKLEQLIKDLRLTASSRLDSIVIGTLKRGKSGPIPALEAAEAALAEAEAYRRTAVEWSTRDTLPSQMSNLAWLLHESQPGPVGSRQWVRLRFLTEAYGFKGKRSLADVGRRLIGSGSDSQLDAAFLYEVLTDAQGIQAHSGVIEAAIHRLATALPRGIYYRTVARSFRTRYAITKDVADLRKAILYRSDWLRLAPPDAIGRTLARQLLEHDQKLLRGLTESTRR